MLHFLPDLIISGGQTGADFGGLLAAESLKIATGGFAPRGFRTENGPKPELGSRFGLVESDSDAYSVRTRENVDMSDAGLIICLDFRSPGSLLTEKIFFEQRKPFFKLQYFTKGTLEPGFWLEDAQTWLTINRPAVLMIAGNRESKARGIERWSREAVRRILVDAHTGETVKF